MISFARGAPATECLPIAEFAECARAAIERDGAAILNYGHPSGYAPLRSWIAGRHGVDPARVLVTNGSLEGSVFFASHFLAESPGARVLVEAPTYDRPLKILERLGAEIVALPVDEDGLDVEALERELESGSKPAFLYTIPTFQNPSGRTLTAERRYALVEIAREHDLLVLEDDPYGLVRFDGEPLPSLFELDGGEHVVYSSSFSKTIAPGVRVGYYVLPASLEPLVEEIAVSTYISPVLPTQAAVYEFVSRGYFEPNIERVCGLLKPRRDAMLAALERELPAGASWSRPDGGYFLWVELPEGVSAGELQQRAAPEVAFVKGADFFPGGSGGAGSARLAFSFASLDEIAAGVARLAALLPAATTA